jgi:hypothetical protein
MIVRKIYSFDLNDSKISLSDNTLSDNDRKQIIKDWLWEIEQELQEISSSSMNAETKEKIKTLLNQIGDLVVVEDKKNEDEKV